MPLLFCWLGTVRTVRTDPAVLRACCSKGTAGTPLTSNVSIDINAVTSAPAATELSPRDVCWRNKCVSVPLSDKQNDAAMASAACSPALGFGRTAPNDVCARSIKVTRLGLEADCAPTSGVAGVWPFSISTSSACVPHFSDFSTAELRT
jgi:hypothetical protein